MRIAIYKFKPGLMELNEIMYAAAKVLTLKCSIKKKQVNLKKKPSWKDKIQSMGKFLYFVNWKRE